MERGRDFRRLNTELARLVGDECEGKEGRWNAGWTREEGREKSFQLREVFAFAGFLFLGRGELR